MVIISTQVILANANASSVHSDSHIIMKNQVPSAINHATKNLELVWVSQGMRDLDWFTLLLNFHNLPYYSIIDGVSYSSKNLPTCLFNSHGECIVGA